MNTDRALSLFTSILVIIFLIVVIFWIGKQAGVL